MLGAEALIECLKVEDVEYIFGIPGITIVPITDVLAKSKGITYVSTRHEQIAVHMADGYARASGKIGVVLAARMGGASNMVLGVTTAFSSDSPVLIVAGDVPTENLGRGDFQEVDMVSLFGTITKFSYRVERAEKIPEVIRRAIKIALEGRPGPVFVSIPKDLLLEDKEMIIFPQERYHVTGATRPDAQLVTEAAALLVKAKNPVILAGNGIAYSNGSDELAKLAELLGAPVIVAPFGRRDILSTTSPFYARDTSFVSKVDVALVVGTNRTDAVIGEFSKIPSQAKIIHIESDSRPIAQVHPADVGIVANPKTALKELISLVEKQVGPTERRETERRLTELKKRYEVFQETRWPKEGWDAKPILPWRLVRDIRETIAKNAIVTQDSGAFGTEWISRCFEIYEPNTYYTCLGGIMGFGVPGALGIKLAKSDRQIIAIVGDGAFMMVLAALDTMVNYSIPITIVINNNSSHMQIKWKQKYQVGTNLKNPDFAQIASLFGAVGERIEDPEEIRPALQRALALNKKGKSVVLDVITSPEPKNASPVLYFAPK